MSSEDESCERPAPDGTAGEEREPLLAVARIVRPQGRRGEVAAEILTDFPARFAKLERVFVGTPGETPRPTVLVNSWPHKGRIILKFSGVNCIEEASRLRGSNVLIPRRERVALGEHQYYVWELKGCRVVAGCSDNSQSIGTVTEIEPTGGVDLLRVRRADGGEVLIPLAQEICRRIDLEAKIIGIDPPEELLNLNG